MPCSSLKKRPTLYILVLLILFSLIAKSSTASQRRKVASFYYEEPNQLLSLMSLEEKLGQILIFGFDDTNLDDEMKRWIVTGKIGNIKIFLRNVTSKEQLKSLTSDIKRLTDISDHGIPPFIATDMEGGMVNHIRYEDISLAPSAGLIGASFNCSNCTYASRLIALTLRESGINMNFAPCVDVLTNPQNRVIGTRSYGSDPLEVYYMARAFIREHEKYGITAVAKHFPGHGMTDFDTHTSALCVGTGKDEIQDIHLLPYKQLIKEGILRGCMVSHVIYSELDHFYPASFSPVIVNGLLRNELGFDGLIVTDDLEMAASEDFSGDIVKSFILAFRSGADLFLISHKQEKQKKFLEQLYLLFESGILEESELDSRVLRVLLSKQVMLSRFYEALPYENEKLQTIEATSRILRDASEEGIVAVSSRMNEPLGENAALSLQRRYRGVILAPLTRFRELAYEYFPTWDVLYIRYKPGRRENIRRIKQYRDQLKGYDLVIIGMVNSRQAAWANVCIDEGIPFFILSMENPFFALEFRDQAMFIAACFSPYSPEPDALFECVFHTGKLDGRFPYAY
jgi:beta-N-acetylhexosaminidase